MPKTFVLPPAPRSVFSHSFCSEIRLIYFDFSCVKTFFPLFFLSFPEIKSYLLSCVSYPLILISELLHTQNNLNRSLVKVILYYLLSLIIRLSKNTIFDFRNNPNNCLNLTSKNMAMFYISVFHWLS